MDCPSARSLLAFAQDDSSADARVASHIATCKLCAGFIDDVLSEDVVEDEDIIADALRLKTGQHLTPRLLFSYYENKLGGSSQDLVMDHLAICEKCGAAVLDLTESGVGTWSDFLAKHGDALGFSGQTDDPGS